MATSTTSLLVPTTSDPYYSQVSTLDGVDYVLTFTYDMREDCWYLTVSTPDGDDLARGRKIVCNWNLLIGKPDDRLPKGLLMAVTTTPDDSPPRLADLAPSGRVNLVYFPAGTL